MKDLKEKVQSMLDGEAKRREVALQWINEVVQVILPAAEALWGSGECSWDGIGEGTTTVKAINGKYNSPGDIYFRFVKHESIDKTAIEEVGYYVEVDGYHTWGKSITDLKGSNFWWAIRTIMEWIPTVSNMMTEKGLSRDNLVAKMK